MWKKISTAISILCITVYVFAVALAVFKIVNAAAEHRIIFEQEFAKLQDIVRGTDVLGFTGADLENEIRVSVLRSLAIDAAIVTASDGAAFAVEKPGEQAVIPNYNNAGYSFNIKWKFYRPPYSARITADGRTPLEINALAGYINRDRLGDILRETLLIVLLSVMVAFLVLMLDVIVFNTDNTGEHKEKKPKPPKSSNPPYEPIFNEDATEIPLPVEMPIEEPVSESAEMPVKEPMPESAAEPAEIPTEEPMPESAAEPAEMPVEEPLPESAAVPIEEPLPESAAVPVEEPMGIYFGLIQKLHKELAIADEKKTDIALLCAEWTKNGFAADTDAPFAKQIAEEAAIFFNVDRISAFKRGKTGIFIVLPGVAFAHGLKAAREFHGRILDNTAFKTTITNFYVGFTSHAGRRIDPDRLILEAEKAVEKAKEDAAKPIVAFKADPSKYKNYLRKH
jgi:hypothetical protein